jgi:zinc protease
MLVDMADAPQSRIMIGSAGASNAMADFFPIQVLNTVLQGRLSSDRNQTLRDYTTGVRSGFDMRKSATPFVVTAAAQADKTAASVKALIDELAGVAKGIAADDLARAKDDISVKFPRTFESTGRISSRLRALESLIVYGLPDDYYANYVRAIQAVDSAEVQRLAQEYIQPDHLTTVIVGDRKTLEPPLRALNLGSIKNVSVDEVFAPAK